MLQAPIVEPQPSHSLRAGRGKNHRYEDDGMDDDDSYGDDDHASGGKGRKQSRRELPTGAVATLKAWLLSPEHFTHPYPTPQDQAILMEKTGIDKKQLKNWFTNARRRIWKPMLKKQIEQGKISATGASLVGMQTPSMDNPHSVQAMRVHYQQAMQDQPVQAQQQMLQQPVIASVDQYGNPIYSTSADVSSQFYGTGDSSQLVQNSSMGTLAQLSSTAQLSKTDSHAVLMELFARDQDLVRQATESARLKAESKQQQQQQQSQQQEQAASTAYTSNNPPQSQHPMLKAPSSVLQSVPSLNSWPHFSSITSLNNLGTIPGVKSIASLSGQDLASKGNVNRMGNLAQVKSMESMGRNDSYAFLEVFFGDRSATNLSDMCAPGGNPKSMLSKHSGDEDNEIGLSLEDESPSHSSLRKEYHQQSQNSLAPAPAPVTMSVSLGQSQQADSSSSMDTGTIKRAYDDAMAARGLISVSRSSENLTDLVLPAKIQRTLSREFIKEEEKEQIRQQHQLQLQLQQQQNALQKSQQPVPTYNSQSNGSQQYPGQHPTEPQGSGASDSHEISGSQQSSVVISSSTTCCLCDSTCVDTELRPCGHMFHERCLKPSLSNPNGPPKCPIDDIPIESALLAVPETTSNSNGQQQPWSSYTQADVQQ